MCAVQGNRLTRLEGLLCGTDSSYMGFLLGLLTVCLTSWQALALTPCFCPALVTPESMGGSVVGTFVPYLPLTLSLSCKKKNSKEEKVT